MRGSFLFSFLARRRAPIATRTGSCCTPTLEVLEDRFMPSSTPAAVLVGDHANSALTSPNALTSTSTTSSLGSPLVRSVDVQASLALGVHAAAVVNPSQTATTTGTAPTVPDIFTLKPVPSIPVVRDTFLLLTGGGGDEPDYGFTPVIPRP
jgi:hypothetical protein